MTKVTKNPKTNAIFTQSMNADGTAKLDKNGKPFGFIRVQSDEVSLGFSYNRGAVKSRSALISMTLEAWNKSKSHLTEGLVVPGKIVRHDSLKPFYAGQKALQTAEGVAITAGGAPVYRNEVYTEIASEVDSKEGFEAFDILEAVAPAKKKGQLVD